jgi:hypothetical protein
VSGIPGDALAEPHTTVTKETRSCRCCLSGSLPLPPLVQVGVELLRGRNEVLGRKDRPVAVLAAAAHLDRYRSVHPDLPEPPVVLQLGGIAPNPSGPKPCTDSACARQSRPMTRRCREQVFATRDFRSIDLRKRCVDVRALNQRVRGSSPWRRTPRHRRPPAGSRTREDLAGGRCGSVSPRCGHREPEQSPLSVLVHA